MFKIYDEPGIPRKDPAPSGWPSRNRAMLCKLQRAKSLHEQRGLQMYIQKEVATSDRLEFVNYLELAEKNKTHIYLNEKRKII